MSHSDELEKSWDTPDTAKGPQHNVESSGALDPNESVVKAFSLKKAPGKKNFILTKILWKTPSAIDVGKTPWPNDVPKKV